MSDQERLATREAGLGPATAEAAGGDGAATALREHLVANYARLHSRLHRHLGCAEQASECLHDAWIRLGEAKLHAAIQSPDAYVYRTACNLATDRLRGSMSWRYASEAEVELDGLADPAPGPDRIAEARSDMLAMERAVQDLPRRHRAVLVALRIDEMSRQEVAERYQLSLRGVDTALRQALDHCGAVLSGGADLPRPGAGRHSST